MAPTFNPGFVLKQIYLVIGPGPDILQLWDWIENKEINSQESQTLPYIKKF